MKNFMLLCESVSFSHLGFKDLQNYIVFSEIKASDFPKINLISIFIMAYSMCHFGSEY